MKKILFIATAVLTLAVTPAFAQAGGQTPHFDGAIDKLFGGNQAFMATLEIQTTGENGTEVTMPGKMNFDTGKTCFQMNIGDVKGSALPPDAAARMKSMGMDVVITIARPDLKQNLLVYPGLNSYAVIPSQESSASLNPDDFKVETAAIGKETVDGHDCVKNKTTVTDKDGNKHDYTVWNAGDLKNFPVKIQADAQGRPVTMSYKNVTFTKPSASVFEAPAGYTKYDNVQTMMQTEVMKKMSSAGGAGGIAH
jgi:hypothetical protein